MFLKTKWLSVSQFDLVLVCSFKRYVFEDKMAKYKSDWRIMGILGIQGANLYHKPPYKRALKCSLHMGAKNPFRKSFVVKESKQEVTKVASLCKNEERIWRSI